MKKHDEELSARKKTDLMVKNLRRYMYLLTFLAVTFRHMYAIGRLFLDREGRGTRLSNELRLC